MLRAFALVARCLKHFLAVIICAGRKIHAFAAQTVVARNRISGHHLIGMANVRFPIWVRNCGTYVKLLI
jgi:hypothetical protein